MKLKDYLDKTGIPIAKFARRCNLTYPQIRHIIRGNVPTLESALKIEKYTEGQVAPNELLTPSVFAAIYSTELSSIPYAEDVDA